MLLSNQANATNHNNYAHLHVDVAQNIAAILLQIGNCL